MMAIAAVFRARARARLAETRPDYEYCGGCAVRDKHVNNASVDENSSAVTFVDVYPKVNRFNLYDNDSQPTSYAFGTVLNDANQWLAEHPQWSVMNCETLSFPLDIAIKSEEKKEMQLFQSATLHANITSYPVMTSCDPVHIRFLR